MKFRPVGTEIHAGDRRGWQN